MKIIIRFISNKFGVDGAIAYSVLARLIQGAGGVISILFIAKYLNKIEQGYYFTFASLLAIQFFFELGLSNIIIQFVAHEIAHLHWINKTELTGSEESKSRLSSLLRFYVKWFLVVSILLIFVLLFIGNIFFSKYGKENASVDWMAPWLILSVTTGCSLLISPVLAFLEGLGKVEEVAKIRLTQQVCQLILIIVFFSSGLKLFANPLAAFVALIIAPTWILFSSKKKLLLSIWSQLDKWRVNYWKEIYPYQWRIALSWISSYFIFQLFNPVLFATSGPVVAGQMGMTLAALSGVLAVSVSWINTKIPVFSSLIAKKNFKYLDILFNKTLKQSSLICGGCLILLILIVFSLQTLKLPIGNRILPILPFTLLCIATFSNQLVLAMATYLRCHKQEPLVMPYLVLGLLTATSTILLGKFYGLNGIVWGYSLLIVFISLTWSAYIFIAKKKLWH
ncbi:MAG: hypothetical protein JWP81_4137 [Ferruginibacter sp.]|nr:hypothetical protein [Ferruginibacter sp.]